MQILIIGSMGFIGYHLKRYLRQALHEVYECDIIKNSDQKNYIRLDTDKFDYDILFNSNKYDVCINCSGAANVSKSFDDIISDFELNAYNVLKFLEVIRKVNPECKFINISSAAVYGNPMKIPIEEKTELLPISPYGYHKLISEYILDEYNKLWGIKTCSVRIFSAYGNGLKKQILYDISKKILMEEEIHLFGTGNETRDFIHIDDICQAIDCIIKSDKFQSSKINVANGEQIAISEIIEIFNKLWRHNKKIVFNGVEKQGDPVNWCADINLLRSYGYRQTVNINDGVERYINWIQSEKLV
jgi:dTDP-glucose 4,6-dehydratase/UDP-glucose 4-epimerase